MVARREPSGSYLEDRVAIVTGSGQGIGRAIAQRFAAEGAHVVIATRSEGNARETEALIRADGGDSSVIQTDCGAKEQIFDLISAVERTHGRLDILVHNAAVFPFHLLLDLPEEALEQTLDVNLKAAFRFVQAANHLISKSDQGRYLFTSSVTGPHTAIPGLSHYAASKSGLNGFIRSAALELAGESTTVNGVEPGLIRTPAVELLGDKQAQAQMAQNIPMGRLGDPDEIAKTMLFLASDLGSYITGQTILVDGGAVLTENTAIE